MLVRVKLHGSGKDDDPYRVNLPTYRLVHGNATQGYAIVFIPDDAHGLTEEDLQGENSEVTTEGTLYPALSGGTIRKVHAHFDKHYEGHNGKFQLESA